MRSKVAENVIAPPESDEDPRRTELVELAAALMRRARSAPLPVTDEATPAMLDVECDGKRYILMRTAAPQEVTILSPREREIARMVARGFPNKAIAAVLEISTWTVGTYLRRIFAKLHVTSRAAMVAKLRWM